MKANPWDLTAREAETLDAVCATGCNKLAARALGISSKTVEAHLTNAKEKMSFSGLGPSRGPGRLLQILEWDRWRRHVISPGASQLPLAAPATETPEQRAQG